MRRRMAVVLVVVAGWLATAGALAAQSGEAAGITAIQRLNNLRDYEGAYMLADSLVRVFPKSLTLKNRWLGAMGIVMPGDRVRQLADSLMKAFPDSLAAQQNIGMVDGKQKETLEIALRVRALTPWDPDVLVGTAWTLRQTDGGAAKAVAMLDSALARGVHSSLVLWAKAAAMLDSRYPNEDGKAYGQATALAREAIRTDSTDLGGYLLLATALQRQSDNEGSYQAYRRAIQLAPVSALPHRDYWDAVQRVKGREEARKEIVADVRAMVAARPASPFGLRIAANTLARLGEDALADSLRGMVIAMDPNGIHAEFIAEARITALGEAMRMASKPDSLRREQIRLLREFIARPVHHSASDLDGYKQQLFSILIADSTSDPAELERLGDGVLRVRMTSFWTAHEWSIQLSDRRAAPGLAERFARIIPVWAEAFDSALGRRPDTLSPELAERLKVYRLAWPHDALGWVAFTQGRVAEGDAELKRALAAAPKEPSVVYHAARIAEARGRTAEAERLYMRGYVAERTSPSHDSEKALRRLYAARHGSETGFDQFISGLQAKERAERKQKVLASRLKQPRPMPEFRLARIQGDTLSSTSLAGKVVVVNFWGVWCGPCVAELPHIQKAYANYRADPDVAFLTVDKGDELATLKDYLAKHSVELPVLLDNGFSDRVRVHGYPTTWFIGKDGKIIFEVTGGSDTDTITEEFGWRIEALKGGK